MVTLRKVDFQSWKRHSLVVKLAKDLFYFLKDVLTFQSDGERIYKFSKVNARRKRSRGVSLPLFLTGRIRSLIFNLCLPLFPFSDPSGKKKKKKAITSSSVTPYLWHFPLLPWTGAGLQGQGQVPSASFMMRGTVSRSQRWQKALPWAHWCNGNVLYLDCPVNTLVVIWSSSFTSCCHRGNSVKGT